MGADGEIARLNREIEALREELKQVRDTEKAHRRELEFKNLILDTIQAVVVVLHAGKHDLRYANRHFQKLSGYTLGEMKTVPSIWETPTLSDEEKAHYAELMRRMAAGERPLSWENWYITKDKEQRRAVFTSTMLDDENGKPEYLIASGIDITELHRTQEQLRQAKEEAENATRLKDEFVALVTHDLRSPLASLIQMVHALKDSAGEAGKKEAARAFNGIIGQCEAMMNLIERLLNLSRIRSGKIILAREELRVKALVEEVYGSMEHLARRKAICFDNRLPETVSVNADRALLAEVVRNLLSNAIKFSRFGGTVSAYIPESGAHLAIRDHGVGIPNGLLTVLFGGEQKTVRRGTAGEEGTGFGLPFCREIMELHGGRISAESEEGKGSAFLLHLPRG